MEARLKETKILINSILTASENALSLGQLEGEYKMMENEYIPFKEYGFKSLLEFLQSCSDIVRIVHVGGTAQLLPVVGEESKHIRDLVEKQKKDPSKKVPYKITQPIEENILRLLAKVRDHQLPIGRLSSNYMKNFGKPLPAPKGKLVAWLGTSNKFAILTLDKNVKIIEPLSHVDLSRYKPSGSGLSDSSIAALRSSVLNALSGPQKQPEPGSAWSAATRHTPQSQPHRSTPYSAANAGGEAHSWQNSSWSQGAPYQPNPMGNGYHGSSYPAPQTTTSGGAQWNWPGPQGSVPSQPQAQIAPSTTRSVAGVAQPQFTHAQSPAYTQPRSTYDQERTPYMQSAYMQAQFTHVQPTLLNRLVSAYSTPSSAHAQPQIAYTQPQSSHVQPQPTYAQPQSTYVQPQSAYVQPRTAQSQSQPTRAVPQPLEAEQSSTGLTPEIRKLLVKLMMKNPDSTSVPALHKAYEYHKGSIEIRTFYDWLVSMCECMVIGGQKGRIYLRPDYRLAAAPPDATTPTPQPSPQIRTTVPSVKYVPQSSVAGEAAPNETLKVTIRATAENGHARTNGWQRVVETTASTDEVSSAVPLAPGQQNVLVESQPGSELEASSVVEQGTRSNDLYDIDRALEGISGLCVTDIIDVIEMMRRRPKVPLDQLLSEFQETFQKTIEPNDGVEGFVATLCELGLLKLAQNSDVSLYSPVSLRSFTYEPGTWQDVTTDESFWYKFIEGGSLTEGISMAGKIASYNETGFTFAPNWSPPDELYRRAEIKAGESYVYCDGQQKLRAVAHSAISMAGRHWLIYLPDLAKFRPCRKEKLFVGPPQPVFDVIPIGRCPPVGKDIKLKIVQVLPSMTFACVDDEEPCCKLVSKVDANFNFRVVHWDNQRFVPREDLAKLSLEKGLTSMDSSAITHGENFAAGSWMKEVQDPFFVPMTEFVELLETEGFRKDEIHDLLLI